MQDEGAHASASVAGVDAGEAQTAPSLDSRELDEEKIKRTQSINAAADIAASAAAAAAANTVPRGRGPGTKISMGSAPVTSLTQNDEIDDDGSVISALEGPDSIVADDRSQQSLTIQAQNKQIPRGPRPGPVATSPSGLKSKRGFMHAQTEEDVSRANLLLKLLDNSTCPFFQKASRLSSSRHKDDISVASLSTDGTTRSHSMDPFIIKELPEIKVKHSVGGLNTHQAEDYWRIINSSNYDLDTLKGGHAMDAKEEAQKMEFASIKRTKSQRKIDDQAGNDKAKEQESSPARAATAVSSKRIKKTRRTGTDCHTHAETHGKRHRS